MAFQISPGVNVSEVDLTTVVPSVLTTAGAFAGTFRWGPADKIKLVDSEITLVSTFGAPDSNSATSFFTAANFLAYGNNLSIVRALNSGSRNATANASASVLVKNEDVFEDTYLNTDNQDAYGAFMSRYAGTLGNSLKVSVFDSSNTTLFNQWDYKAYFNGVPGTSDSVEAVNGANDEFHIVVVDENGLFTGSAGTVLETYPYVSKASDATLNGATNYYKQVLFNNSRYVYAVDPVDYANTSSSWGLSGVNTTFARVFAGTQSDSMVGGLDAAVTQTTNGDLVQAYDMFANKEVVDISLVLTGDAPYVVQQEVIDNVVTVRKDCVAFISPPASAVVNNAGSESADITSWLSNLSRSSSYVVADSGWKYQFDKYNNEYRWIPLNADIAGLCVFTDSVRDPWYSPAGFNRGAIKNSVKLAWNPSKTFRDALYAQGVNPVVSFPGQGTVLFGDKTLQAKPSAFDRINVRRLFLVLEKAISNAAQYSLFELNEGMELQGQQIVLW